MSGLAQLRLGILVSIQTFTICLAGYYLDGRQSSVGICTIIMGVMVIVGLWMYPTRSKKETTDGR